MLTLIRKEERKNMKKNPLSFQIDVDKFGSASESEKRSLESPKSKDIIILHTNDVHCGVNDTIGYDGLMLYKKQLLNGKI